MSRFHSHDHGDNCHGHSHTHSTPSDGSHDDDADMEHGVVDENELKEAQHFCDVMRTFAAYGTHSFQALQRSENMFRRIDPQLQTLVPSSSEKFKRMRAAVLENHKFIRFIVEQKHVFQTAEDIDYEQLELKAQDKPVSESNMSKVRSTLRSCSREWSAFGAAERAECYGPFLTELNLIFASIPPERRGDIRVLTPGCGLGRLTWEIARLGFASQGNEFAYFMLMASYVVLNCIPQEKHYTLYPFVHTTTNVMSIEDNLMPVQIPDAHPGSLPYQCEFSMVAGDFLEVYGSQPDSWDVVATCFFIDTANNILEYIRTIHHILKPGGYWINLGPLLYHFADMETENSIELTYEELKLAIPKLGFRFLKEQTRQRTSYTNVPNSMLEMTYLSWFFVCQKPSEPALPDPARK